MNDRDGAGSVTAKAGAVIGLTLRQILLSKRTIIVLIFCVIPLLLSMAWASGWKPDNPIFDEEIEEDHREDRDNGIEVSIDRAEMDIRDEGGDIIIEASFEGKSENEKDPFSGIERVMLEWFVDLNLEEDEEFGTWIPFGMVDGVTLISPDSAALPAGLRSDLVAAVQSTPEQERDWLIEATGNWVWELEDMGIQGIEGMAFFDAYAEMLNSTGWNVQQWMLFEQMPLEVLLMGGTHVMMFGTGPGGLDDWSSWTCYIYQRIGDNVRELLSEIPDEFYDRLIDIYEDAPKEVRRGEVRGYVHARAWGGVLDPFSGGDGFDGDGGRYEEGDYNNAWKAIEFPEPDPDDEYGFDIFQNVVGGLYLFFIIPLTALLYATVAISTEVTNRTMTYMTSRPIHRFELYVYRFVGYYAATLVITLPPLVLTFMMFGSQSGDYSGHMDVLLTYTLVTALYILGLGGMFFLFCSLMNHPIILGLIYTFFWEDLMSQAPMQIRFFTINFHIRSIIDRLLGDAAAIYVYKPVPLGDAYLSILAVFGATFILGVLFFSNREYH